MMSAAHSRSAAAIFCRTSLDSSWARLAASAHVTCCSTTSSEIAPADLNLSARIGTKSGRGITTALRKSLRHGFTASNRAANSRAACADGIVSSAKSAGAGCMVSKSSVCTRSAAYSGWSITEVTHARNCTQASRVAAPGGAAWLQLARTRAIHATLLRLRQTFRCTAASVVNSHYQPQLWSLVCHGEGRALALREIGRHRYYNARTGQTSAGRRAWRPCVCEAMRRRVDRRDLVRHDRTWLRRLTSRHGIACHRPHPKAEAYLRLRCFPGLFDG